jgi:hypothetical protein
LLQNYGNPKLSEDSPVTRRRIIAIPPSQEYCALDNWRPYNPTTTVGRLNRRNFRPCSSSSLISLAASPFFPNERFWTVAGITYRDAMVLSRMLTSDVQEARSFLSALKEQLQEEVQPGEILIIERDVETL